MTGTDAATVATAMTLYAAVVVSPGPNFALISRLALSGRRSAAFGATFGLAIGATLYAVLTMAGFALVIARIGWLATAVQVAGGAYLVWLGLSAWRAGHGAAPGAATSGGWGRGLRTGLLVNLSNPKAIAFFLGFYAVAIPPGTSLPARAAILLGGFAIEIVWYGLVTLGLSRRRARAVYDRFSRWIERAIGTILAAFGLRLIAEKL